MIQVQTLSFDIGPSAVSDLAIVPRIDGASLIDLVTAYEAERAFDVIGGYGGLIPAYFDYGPLDRYFLEGLPWEQRGEWPDLYVLGCNCGEVGCWPLGCELQVGGEWISWRAFNQEHRPDRDYSGFGPFTFARPDYLRALADLPKA